MPDTSECGTTTHALSNGNAVFSNSFVSPSFVQMRDGETGKLIWKHVYPSGGFILEQILANEDRVFINNWDRTVAVNAQTGQTDWDDDISATGEREILFDVKGDYIYANHFRGGKPKTYTSSIVRTHCLDGHHWDTLLSINAQPGYSLNIYPPSLWLNPQGDTVLIVRENGFVNVGQPLHEGRTNLASLYAFNLRTRQYEWQRYDFEDEWSFSIFPPLIENGRLYINCRKTTYCVDLLTGNTLWRKDFEYFMNGNPLSHKNLVVVQSNHQGMWGLDKSTGAIVWYNPDIAGSPLSGLAYFDGVAYFTSTGTGMLYAVNAETGKTIWAERSPNYSSRTPNVSFGWSGVVIDPLRRVLFVSDNYWLMCVKLPV